MRRYKKLVWVLGGVVLLSTTSAIANAMPLPYQYYPSAETVTVSPTSVATTEGDKTSFTIRIAYSGDLVPPGTTYHRWLKQIFVRPDAYSDIGRGYGVERSFSMGNDGYTTSMMDDQSGYYTRIGTDGTVNIPLNSLDDNIAQGTHQSNIRITETDYVEGDNGSSPTWTPELDDATVVNTIADNDTAAAAPSPSTSKATTPNVESTQSDYNLDTYDAYNHGDPQPLDLKNNQTVAFSIDGNSGKEQHTAKVIDLTVNSVTFLIASQPFEVTLKPGETGEYDVTDDPINDIQLVVLGIHDGIANVTFKRIHSPAGSTPGVTSKKTYVAPPRNAPSPKSHNTAYVWTGSLAGALLVAAAPMYFFRKSLSSLWRRASAIARKLHKKA